MKNLKGVGFYLVILVVVLGLIYVISEPPKPKELPYSQLITQINIGNVKKIDFDGQTAKVEFRTSIDGKNTWNVLINPNSTDSFSTIVTGFIKEGKLDEKSFNNTSKPFSIWSVVSFLPYVLMLVLLVFIWMSFMNNSQGGGANKAMSFGRSRAKMSTDADLKTTFNDVAGAKEEKEELEEIVDFLKSPKRFIDIGGRIPKGVLLIGPPGTGKTLLAKAVAGEAKVPFFSLSGSDFVEMFVGVGASRVRDLFEQAKKNAPSIVFIDEIDAVGRHRGAGLGGGHDEREQTLNQLLVEMDGFGVNEGVIVLAATNRADILDPALLRPGRFDRKVYIGRPDIRGREEILMVHARNKKLATDVDLKDIAKTTPGFTGADLENLLNEAALIAARKDKMEIDMDDIKEANYKVMLGPEKKSRVMTERDKKVTAIHEAGHAIAVKLLSSTQHVDRVSIISVGQAGGYTAYKPQEDISYETKGQLIEYIMISLAGMAAEELELKEKTTGAYSDLQSANSIARKMVTRYGMSDKLGPLIFGDDKEEVFIGRDLGHARTYSESFAAEIDHEVKKIIDDAYAGVSKALLENREHLVQVADLLLEKERISAEEFEALFSGEEVKLLDDDKKLLE